MIIKNYTKNPDKNIDFYNYCNKTYYICMSEEISDDFFNIDYNYSDEYIKYTNFLNNNLNAK